MHLQIKNGSFQVPNLNKDCSSCDKIYKIFSYCRSKTLKPPWSTDVSVYYLISGIRVGCEQREGAEKRKSLADRWEDVEGGK